jgi:hypothetical protein
LIDKFYAPDKDDGVNSHVSYEISSIEPFEIDREEVEDFSNLFVIESYDLFYARIKTGVNLKGFSGKWKLTIHVSKICMQQFYFKRYLLQAKDHGEEGDSGFSLSSTQSYIVSINAFNFNEPKIIFPFKDKAIRLE